MIIVFIFWVDPTIRLESNKNVLAKAAVLITVKTMSEYQILLKMVFQLNKLGQSVKCMRENLYEWMGVTAKNIVLDWVYQSIAKTLKVSVPRCSG